MEMWAFDACNFRCGYCSLVTSGAVTRVDQLERYRDEQFIKKMVSFLDRNRPSDRRWAVIVTGGEPFMMPNLDLFVKLLGAQGDCAAFYTNNSIHIDKIFSKEALEHISYIECSFHPDWHRGKFQKQTFFDNVKAIVDKGIGTTVRFVGAPQIIDLLDELETLSFQIGAGFLPTTLFDPVHPKGYAPDIRNRLAEAMSGFSSLIQLDGGLLANDRLCDAGSRLFAVRMHQGGNITPCISTDQPVFGNIYDETFYPRPSPSICFKNDGLCTCDIHFQQHVVHGVDDSENFSKILNGEKLNTNAIYNKWKSDNNIETSDDIWAGQGEEVSVEANLLRVAPKLLKKKKYDE